MTDDKENVSFPRGGSGPAQPLPKGAHIAAFAFSLLAIGSVVALMAWMFL
jgi:hypothetical protein